jgi:hypothetical protein
MEILRGKNTIHKFLDEMQWYQFFSYWCCRAPSQGECFVPQDHTPLLIMSSSTPVPVQYSIPFQYSSPLRAYIAGGYGFK